MSAERTPVIIAACEEEALIGRALRRLPASEVEPIVAVNGSRDGTAEVARGFGARVIELADMGKLPAQQEAVRQLRDAGHSPEDAIVFMDADSFPAFPHAWARLMSRRRAEAGTPEFTSGLTGFVGGNLAVNALRTVRRLQLAIRANMHPVGDLSTVYGINMSVTFGTDDMVDQFLALPHIWPGEDRATAHMIIKAGGEFHQSTNPGSLVLASDRYNIPLSDRLRHGAGYARDVFGEMYAARQAPLATHRFDSDTNTTESL